jgi:hypothetical protein
MNEVHTCCPYCGTSEGDHHPECPESPEQYDFEDDPDFCEGGRFYVKPEPQKLGRYFTDADGKVHDLDALPFIEEGE